jgi:hypothetical protein
VKNPAKVWPLDGGVVLTGSGYTSEGTLLEDVVRKLVKTAFREHPDATSFILQANWQEGGNEGSYFTGTATVVT